MELTLPQFVELLQGFESSPDMEDVRRTARISVRRNVAIRVDPGSQADVDVVLQDISRGGVCITHHEGLPRDKTFLLLLPRQAGERLKIPCIVRHCAMVKQHLFRIGAQFQEARDAPLL